MSRHPNSSEVLIPSRSSERASTYHEDLLAAIPRVEQCMSVDDARRHNLVWTIVGLLPPELLLAIVMFAVDTDPPIPVPSGQSPHYGWLAVLWVCAPWRAHILHAPCVWARASCHLPRATLEIQELSGACSRTYEVTRAIPACRREQDMDTYDDYLRIFDMLLQTDFEHVVVINLEMRGPVIDHLVRLAAVSPLPSLRSLKAVVFEPVDAHSCTTQSAIFCDARKHTIVAPNLTDATFGDCLVWLETKALRFYHAFFQCPPVERPTVDQFLIGCSAMDTSLVETFILDDIFNVESPSSGTVTKFLALPRVGTIAVSDCLDIMYYLMPALSWRPEARLDLCVVFDDATSSACDSLASVAAYFGPYACSADALIVDIRTAEDGLSFRMTIMATRLIDHTSPLTSATSYETQASFVVLSGLPTISWAQALNLVTRGIIGLHPKIVGFWLTPTSFYTHFNPIRHEPVVLIPRNHTVRAGRLNVFRESSLYVCVSGLYDSFIPWTPELPIPLHNDHSL